MKKRVLAMLLALVMVLSMTACGAVVEESKETKAVQSGASGSESGSEEAGQKVVNIGLSGTVTDISPYKAPDTVGYPIEFSMHQNLFTTASISSQDLIPSIGKSVEFDDNYQTAVIEIFDYVTDVEGNPIDANDVVFSAETLKKLNTQTDTAYIESITATGDYTVELKLTEGSKSTMVKLLTHIHIVDKEAYEANPDTCPGTGRYKVTSFTSGSQYVLEKVENYWQTDASLIPYDQQANVDKMIFHCIPEKTQMTMALESGELQMGVNVDGREAARFEAGGENEENFAVQAFAASMSYVMLLNDTNDSPCNDVNLRKAICYGVDREAIVSIVLNGAGTTINDLVSPALGGYQAEWDEADYFGYDPEKAKDYLAQSGYNGETLKLEGDSNSGTMLELMQAQLGAIGIKVEIQTFENALWQEEKVAGTGESGWDICIDGVGGSLVTNAWKVKFNPANFSTGLPQTGTTDTEVVELLMKAADTQDPADINAFHYYVVENAYAIGVVSPANKYVTVDTITDLCFNNYGQIVPGACNYDAYR